MDLINSLADLQAKPEHRLLECISGSHAYGLAIETSDEDRKGVFFMPVDQLLSLEQVQQVSDEKGDIVFYELGRVFDLLDKSNPTVLEMLFTEDESIGFRHPVLTQLDPKQFLSKQCRNSFAGYAETQIRKARGLNKKIVNPMPKEPRTVLDFCHVISGRGTVGAADWLASKNLDQRQIGLVNLPHMPNCYRMYVDQENAGLYAGIFRKEDSNDVRTSSVPKDVKPTSTLCFNQDGYRKWCREYREYWAWVEKRNDARFEQTIQHGGQYDAKNMMHTFRLLDMAEDIASEGIIHVKRPNRDELLAIRSGEWSYEELVSAAETKLAKIDKAFNKSPLPETPPKGLAQNQLIQLRRNLYL